MRCNGIRLRLFSVSTSGALPCCTIKTSHAAVQRVLIPVGIDIGSRLDVRVSHQFFGHIDRHACPLEVRAKCVSQAVGGQIIRYDRLHDFIAVYPGTHVDIQRTAKALPQPPQTVSVLPVAGLGGEHRGERLPLSGMKLGEQFRVDGNISNARRGLGGLDRPRPALPGRVDMDFVADKIHV